MSFGKIMGVNLKVHYLFLLWLLASATLGEFFPTLILVFSVLIHELGHLFAAKNLNVGVSEVELMPFGGVAKLKRLLGSDPATETAIALAGPANSLVLLIIGMLFLPRPWAQYLLECNVLLLLVNLLPILPLDGGRILKGFVVRREGLGEGLRQILKQTQRAAWVVFFVAVALVFFGLFNVNALVLSVFILYAVRQERKMAPFLLMNYVGTRSTELKTRKVMPVKPLMVEPSANVQEVLSALTPGHYHLFTLVTEGKIVTITEDEVYGAMLTKGLYVTFADVVKN